MEFNPWTRCHSLVRVADASVKAKASASSESSTTIYATIPEIAKALHSILIPLWQVVSSTVESEESIVDCNDLVVLVSDVCIDRKDRRGKAQMVSNLMPVLFDEEPDHRRCVVDVARVNSMSAAFKLFDMDDESSATIKQLLMTLISPNFMKNTPVYICFLLFGYLPPLSRSPSTLKAQLPFIAAQNKAHVLDVCRGVF